MLNNLTIVDDRSAPSRGALLALPAARLSRLSQGTATPIRLTDESDAKTAMTRQGDSFHAMAAGSVTLAGFTVVPSGGTCFVD